MDHFDQYRLIHEEYATHNKEYLKKYKCNHKSSSLKKRRIKGGSFQYVMQCNDCGSPTSQAIPKLKSLEQNNGESPPPFDIDLQETYVKNKKEPWELIWKNFKQQIRKLEKVFGIEENKHDVE